MTDSARNGATVQTQDLHKPRVLPGLRCPDQPTHRARVHTVINPMRPPPQRSHAK